MTNPEIERLCEQFIAHVSEHVESVRVFVTWRDGADESSESFTDGGGNHYAQLGQVREWLLIQDEHAKNSIS